MDALAASLKRCPDTKPNLSANRARVSCGCSGTAEAVPSRRRNALRTSAPNPSQLGRVMTLAARLLDGLQHEGSAERNAGSRSEIRQLLRGRPQPIRVLRGLRPVRSELGKGSDAYAHRYQSRVRQDDGGNTVVVGRKLRAGAWHDPGQCGQNGRDGNGA